MYDAITFKERCILTGHSRTAWVLEFHPSAPHILVSGCLRGFVFLWALGSRDDFRVISQVQYEYPISSISFHPFDNKFAVASGFRLFLWTLDDEHYEPVSSLWNFIEEPTGYQRYIRQITFHPQGRLLLTRDLVRSRQSVLHRADHFSNVKIWDLQQLTAPLLVVRETLARTQAQFSECGNFLAILVNHFNTESVVLYRIDCSAGQMHQLGQSPYQSNQVTYFIFTPHSTHLLIALTVNNNTFLHAFRIDGTNLASNSSQEAGSADPRLSRARDRPAAAMLAAALAATEQQAADSRGAVNHALELAGPAGDKSDGGGGEDAKSATAAAAAAATNTTTAAHTPARLELADHAFLTADSDVNSIAIHPQCHSLLIAERSLSYICSISQRDKPAGTT